MEEITIEENEFTILPNPCIGCWFYDPVGDTCDLPVWERCPEEFDVNAI